MPVICQKTYTIVVAASPVSVTAYWPLDNSTVDTDQVDSVGGSNLIVNSSPVGPGVAGKIGNGVPFNFGSYGRYDTTSSQLNYTAGNSLSYWGWFKILGVDLGYGFSPYFSYYCFFGQQLMIELANTNNPGNVHIMDTAGGNDAYFNVSLGAWHFFHLFHDATQDKCGYSIDNGAEVVFPNAQAWQTDVTCEVILAGGNFAALCSVIFDEIGIVIGNKLTSAQVSYLYNSGNGRTWPITLP